MRFSPSGRTIALTGNGVELWNVAQVLETGLNADSKDLLDDALVYRVNGSAPIAWSPDLRHLATGVDVYSDTGTCSFVIWDLLSGDEPLCVTGHEGVVTALAYDPKGDLIASGSSSSSGYNPGGFDNTARLWNAETGEQVALLGGHVEDVWTVAFSRDGRLLASGSGGCYQCYGEGDSIDGTTRLWGIQ